MHPSLPLFLFSFLFGQQEDNVSWQGSSFQRHQVEFRIQMVGSPVPHPLSLLLSTTRSMFLSSSPAPHMLFHASQRSCPTIGVIASHYVVMATSIASFGGGGEVTAETSERPIRLSKKVSSRHTACSLPTAGAVQNQGGCGRDQGGKAQGGFVSVNVFC